MLPSKRSCFRVFSILIFLLVSPFCINVKKVSFPSSQKQLSWWIFKILSENRCWTLFLLLPALANIEKIHVSMYYTNYANKHKIMLFSSDISITFPWFVKVYFSSVLTKNNTLSLRTQKFSLRINILVVFWIPVPALKTRYLR